MFVHFRVFVASIAKDHCVISQGLTPVDSDVQFEFHIICNKKIPNVTE